MSEADKAPRDFLAVGVDQYLTALRVLSDFETTLVRCLTTILSGRGWKTIQAPKQSLSKYGWIQVEGVFRLTEEGEPLGIVLGVWWTPDLPTPGTVLFAQVRKKHFEPPEGEALWRHTGEDTQLYAPWDSEAGEVERDLTKLVDSLEAILNPSLNQGLPTS